MDASSSPIRVAVLGAGGLGKAAAKIIGMKRELRLTAVCDSRGIVASPRGSVDTDAVARISGDLVEGYRQAAGNRTDEGGGVMTATAADARHCDDPVGEVIRMAEELDAVFIALPNMPNTFIPGIVERFARQGKPPVMVDVLKRTRAVELMFGLDRVVREAGGVVLTGCGATPGLLTAAAVLAAQSFVTVEQVKVWWGVGIANWDAYKATIREDIAHMPGYSVERAKAMTDAEVEALLAETNGLLELRNMEHGDDVLLQRVGVVEDQDQVEVGGVMDTRHAKKPVSTTMTLTGVTFEGKRSSHTFTLGDETTMAANVVGPALGYLKRGCWLKARGMHGVFGCTEFLPMVVK